MQIDDLLSHGCDSPEPSASSHVDPLIHVGADRAGWQGREDEDLVPEPGSPMLSEDEDESEDGGLDYAEPEFVSDDEGPPVRVEIPARAQLTADFQLRAAKAGMFVIVTIFC